MFSSPSLIGGFIVASATEGSAYGARAGTALLTEAAPPSVASVVVHAEGGMATVIVPFVVMAARQVRRTAEPSTNGLAQVGETAAQGHAEAAPSPVKVSVRGTVSRAA